MLKRLLLLTLLLASIFQTTHAFFLDHHHTIIEYAAEMEQPIDEDGCDAHHLLHQMCILPLFLTVVSSISARTLFHYYQKLSPLYLQVHTPPPRLLFL